MADEVLEYLVLSGGGPVDEIVARVGVRPHNIAESLIENTDRGFVTFSGPRTAQDFRDLVQKVREANGYDTEDKRQQRIEVLNEITNHDRAFRETFVRPTRRALMLSVR